jgi:hypothetical protein
MKHDISHDHTQPALLAILEGSVAEHDADLQVMKHLVPSPCPLSPLTSSSRWLTFEGYQCTLVLVPTIRTYLLGTCY